MPTSRLDDRYPELGLGTLPVRPYIDFAYYQLEKSRIFKKFWRQIGRVEEIPATGDYFVKELAASDASVIVTRDRSGAVRAFRNVCAPVELGIVCNLQAETNSSERES
jgi:phenylpropionate dioxygenase-like ring-hydroxylating dioxygenase large terminal subunit